MKKILIVLLYLQLYNTLYSQVDSSAESFFPANIGNVWNYQYAPNFTSQTILNRDSITNNSRYLFFDNSEEPKYKIDSALNVIEYPMRPIAALLYKLTAKKNETWISYDIGGGYRITARVEDIFWDFILGALTQVKRIGYYYQHISDTTNFEAWRNDNYIAAGFGFYLSMYDASQPTELIGCIINGKKYGTVVSVPYYSKNSMPLSYKLYPAFPNPFNPATKISYTLPEDTRVSLKVYNVLGQEVKTLVDEYQVAGPKTLSFNASELPSGVYFYRLSVSPSARRDLVPTSRDGQAGSFTDVKKMLIAR